MAGKKRESIAFEIIVVFAIVAIVGITGQVLVHYQSSQGGAGDSKIAAAKGGLLTGFAVSSQEIVGEIGFNDLSIERIEVYPPSPLIGDPFEVRVYLKNKGFQAIKTPFAVEAKFEPKPVFQDEALEPITVWTLMPQIMLPGQEAVASFLVTTIMPEGPLRITSIADSTGKLKDDHPDNNLMSKTIVVAVE
jgi:hypothetical protein